MGISHLHPGCREPSKEQKMFDRRFADTVGKSIIDMINQEANSSRRHPMYVMLLEKYSATKIADLLFDGEPDPNPNETLLERFYKGVSKADFIKGSDDKFKHIRENIQNRLRGYRSGSRVSSSSACKGSKEKKRNCTHIYSFNVEQYRQIEEWVYTEEGKKFFNEVEGRHFNEDVYTKNAVPSTYDKKYQKMAETLKSRFGWDDVIDKFGFADPGATRYSISKLLDTYRTDVDKGRQLRCAKLKEFDDDNREKKGYFFSESGNNWYCWKNEYENNIPNDENPAYAEWMAAKKEAEPSGTGHSPDEGGRVASAASSSSAAIHLAVEALEKCLSNLRSILEMSK